MTENSTSSAQSAVKGIKASLACGLVAGPLFLLVVAIQVAFRAGFDLRYHPISLLTLGDQGWIQIANFVISGVLVIAFAAGIRQVVHPGRGGTLGPLSVGAFGFGLILAGVFVPDPSLGFPPGTPEGSPASFSLHAILHGVGFILSFSAVTLACIVFMLRDSGLGKHGWASYSIATAVAALAFVVWPGQEGISIRYLVAATIAWAWISLLALRMLREYSHA